MTAKCADGFTEDVYHSGCMHKKILSHRPAEYSHSAQQHCFHAVSLPYSHSHANCSHAVTYTAHRGRLGSAAVAPTLLDGEHSCAAVMSCSSVSIPVCAVSTVIPDDTHCWSTGPAMQTCCKGLYHQGLLLQYRSCCYEQCNMHPTPAPHGSPLTH